MSRLKSLFAAAVVVAIVALAPASQAASVTVKAVVAGSSAMWQSMALAAYNGNGTQGSCLTGFTAPCFHYTAGGFQLNDTRPVSRGGSAIVDSGATIWIVWDSHTTTAGSVPNVVAYLKVDSVVGLRCYYAHPHCNITATGGTFPAPGNKIANGVWGDNNGDTVPPVAIQNLFTATTGPLVTVGASDIRPEDGLFAMCRANSALDAVNYTGLGYNSANASGVCAPAFGGNTLAQLVGSSITGVVSSSSANVAAFSISGKDPFSGQTIPASTTVSAGAAPIIFVAKTNNNSVLSGVTNLTDSELQTVFSGTSCNGTDLGGSSGAITAYLREPLSGTMNTTEATVFRYPDASGKSQETGVNPGAGDNPLNQTCSAGGGSRKRGIGTGDVISGVKNSTGNDAITYTFFSYGNISSLADQSAFRYFTLNGVDPIFHKYVSTPSGTAVDPGQPNASVGEIPGSGADLTAAGCASGFPCPETKIWSGNLSFPNLRNGAYRAWSFVRLVSDGAALATAKTLVTKSQAFVASSTPDFVPAVAVAANVALGIPADPGLQLLRSHYTQSGVSPINQSSTGDKGGDMGGCILHGTPGTTATILAETDTTVKLAQAAPGGECAIVP